MIGKRLSDVIEIDLFSIDKLGAELGVSKERAQRLRAGEEAISSELATRMEQLVLRYPSISTDPDLPKQLFIRDFECFIKHAGDFALFELAIGRHGIGFLPDLRCYLSEVVGEGGDPNLVWEGLTLSDRLALARGTVRAMARMLMASDEELDDGDGLPYPIDADRDEDVTEEFLLATHGIVKILANAAFRTAISEAEVAYERYLARSGSLPRGGACH